MIEKIITNNQFVDQIIYYLKILLMESVLKDEYEADKYETLESARDANIYITCIENTNVRFSLFKEYPVSTLRQANVPEHLYESIKHNINNIPKEFRYNVVNIERKRYIRDYEEKNDYYRLINGLPPIGDKDFIYVKGVPEVPDNIPIHLLKIYVIQQLEVLGVLDEIIEKNPEKRYLRYLGPRKVSIYSARKAINFSLIYTPFINNAELTNKFKETLNKVRLFTMKTVYSEAFKYDSEYYDNFIALFIKIQTAVRIIADIPEIIIKKEFFDEMTIRDMFISHGIEYFPDIPMRYKLKMINNLNTLLKFKSTTINLVDICSLFGFDDIDIFKYYILKDRRVGEDGKFTKPKYKLKADGQIEEIIDGSPSSTYDLKFVKVPIHGNVDDYIRDRENFVPYDEITKADEYWSTGKSAYEIKTDIVRQHFSYYHSKYISIDSMYDMAKVSFELVYFFNMVLDNKDFEDNLYISIPNISTLKEFKIVDAICLLFLLMHERNGVKDNIFDTQGKILHILGFNFQADLNLIANEIRNSGYTLKDLGIDEFTIPDKQIMTYNDFVEIYTKNKNIHDHVTYMMYNANNFQIYKVFKKIYDSLMIKDLNNKVFTINGAPAKTYTDFLSIRDPLIGKFVNNIRLLDPKEKDAIIITTMDHILMDLDDKIKNEDFSFMHLNKISGELIKEYLFKVINFFKSYTVQLMSMNTIYTMNSKLHNKVIIIDGFEADVELDLHSAAPKNYIKEDEIFVDEKGIGFKDDCNIFDLAIIERYDV